MFSAKHGEGPGHGGAGGDQGKGGADWSKGACSEAQESTGGERVWTSVEGELLSFSHQLLVK